MTYQQQGLLEGFEAPEDGKPALEAKFIIPPFSVLDTRQGYWQERKRMWLSLGIKSELGRGEDLTCQGETVVNDNKDKGKSKVNGLTFKGTGFMADIIAERGGGTSIFDPVLCELMYKWFCPPGGIIFDPFAGGSVRGIVAHMLGYTYYGIDLNKPQIEANIEQGNILTPDNPPIWYTGDSIKMDDILLPNTKADFIFSCPPYHDLEKYTDDMDDISNMSWGTFKQQYNLIIAKAILKLKDNRFACFVVSEIRDEVGGYKGLVPYTIAAFTNNGARFYNELILVNVAGSLPVRIAGQFAYRKIGRMHQNVLVFYKGAIDRIPAHYNEIDVGVVGAPQEGSNA